MPYFVGNFSFFPIWFILCHCLGIFAIYDWAERTPLSVLMAIFIGNNYNIGLWLILYPLWFLPCLFFAELIFLKVSNLFAKKIYSFYRVIIVLSAAEYIIGTYFYFQLPLGMDISLVAQLFLLIGFLIRKNDFLHKINFSSLAVLLILFGAAFYFNGSISMNARDYGNIFLFYIGGISGSLILMKISMFFADFSNRIFDFIKYCGKQSLGILMFHIPAINVAYNLMATADKNIGELRHLTPEFDFVIIIFSVIVPALIIKNFKYKPIIKYFCV